MNLEIYDSQLNIAQKAIDNQIIEYSKKINDDPNDFKSLAELIFISLESKQLESALELIEWAFQIHPHSLDLYSAKIQALLKSGRLKEAKIKIYKFIKCYKLDKEYKRTEDKFYLDMKDYLNLVRSAGFRPGLEPLNLKRKDFRYVSSKSNPNQTELIFDVWGTKTKPNHRTANNGIRCLSYL